MDLRAIVDGLGDAVRVIGTYGPIVKTAADTLQAAASIIRDVADGPDGGGKALVPILTEIRDAIREGHRETREVRAILEERLPVPVRLPSNGGATIDGAAPAHF